MTVSVIDVDVVVGGDEEAGHDEEDEGLEVSLKTLPIPGDKIELIGALIFLGLNLGSRV